MKPPRVVPQRRRNRAHPGGFTVLELLVTIALIGLLLALLLPAVSDTRATARRVQCLNNLKNLGFAMLNETETRGRFPSAGNFGVSGGDWHNWVVSLLPFIDQNVLYQKWDFDLQYNDPANLPLAQTHIPVLTCPEDITVSGTGDLSYAVNGGFGWTRQGGIWQVRGWIDLNGDGVRDHVSGTPTDPELYKRTGLFFVENWPPGSGTVRHHRIADVVDGLSQTIMISESVRAGVDPYAPDHLPGNWACPLAWRSSFFLSGYVCRDLKCVPGNVDYGLANSHQEPYSTEALNAAQRQAEGEAPWASSFHEGGLHFCFADGHVKFVAQDIDGAVYAALMSPQGKLLSDTPLAQRVVSDIDF